MVEKLRSSMSANIIGIIIVSMLFRWVLFSAIGTMIFSDSFRKEYAETTYHIADTATTLINGDHLADYLDGKYVREYETTMKYLNGYCHRINVSLIYVIRVDTSNYDHFVSVFNAVNNHVDNTHYQIWELGHKRDTTNNEYKESYKKIYAKSVPSTTIYRRHPGKGLHPHITTMVPITNRYEEVVGILCIQRPMSELTRAIITFLSMISVVTLVFAILAAIIITNFFRMQVFAPINRVSDEASRFARENTKGRPLGKLSPYKELHILANSIDTMETQMLNYVDDLTTITAERERINTELSFASAIQENALPNTFPAFPDRKEFDIFASMRPAKEVGGDFYNFFLVDDDHLALMIGDVSGKGVPAALFMMMSNIMLKFSISSGGSPGEILQEVNDAICQENRQDMFVTLWLGILELSTGKLVGANAGHEDAAICRKGGEFELLTSKHGIIIGAFPGVKYKEFEILLEAGDKIFIYTDGVPEATDADDNMFTLKRMIDVLNSLKEGSPQEILEGVYRSVEEFAGSAPQFDDLTMLGLEYKGK